MYISHITYSRAYSKSVEWGTKSSQLFKVYFSAPFEWDAIKYLNACFLSNMTTWEVLFKQGTQCLKQNQNASMHMLSFSHSSELVSLYFLYFITRNWSSSCPSWGCVNTLLLLRTCFKLSFQHNKKWEDSLVFWCGLSESTLPYGYHHFYLIICIILSLTSN